MDEELKYLDYEGLQEFKRRLDLQIQGEKETILSEISQLSDDKVDIDDISPEVIIEDANGHEYVEIAGIKWATCNVGADNPDDEGLYFAWGETTGYDSNLVGTDKNFSWNDYELGDGGSSASNMTKYNSTDEKTVLELEDDAAAVNMGGSWRMPTIDEIQALEEAVNTEWTNNYNDTGVSGLICTDKTDSSKVLFFPAAGNCYDGTITDLGNKCYYWSSSLVTTGIGAYVAGSNLSYSNSTILSDEYGRVYGFVVRGVLDTVQQKVLGTTITDAERSYWNSKQNALVSGTNIKTINGESVLGEGDISIKSYHTLNNSWNITGTTLQFCNSIVNDTTAVAGMTYSGKIECSDLPAELVQGEVMVLIISEDLANGKNIHLVLTSVNTAPYRWEYSYVKVNGAYTTSGWIGYQTQITSTNKLDYSLINNTPTIPDISGKADLSDLEALELTIEENEEVVAAALNNLESNKANQSDLETLLNKSTVSVVNITSNTSSTCTITGSSNSGKELLIIYRNNTGSDLVVTVPTTYITPTGSAIELVCKNGGYCEVNYINLEGTIFARGL